MSMRVNKLVFIIAITALVGSAMAQGQGRRGGRGGGGNPYSAISLVRNEDVQKELNITDDQKTKITDLQTSMRQKMQDAFQNAGDDQQARGQAMTKVNADAEKDLAAILTPDQVKRLKELQVQWTGVSIVRDKQMQTTLGLTADQSTQIDSLFAANQKANADLWQKMQDQSIDRTQMGEMRQKNTKDLEDGINKVLTDAQKAKLAELGGKPMAKPTGIGQFGGGRRGGGGGGGGNRGGGGGGGGR